MSFDDFTGENLKEHNLNCPQVPDYRNRILITGSCESEKTNVSPYLMSHQPDTDNIYLYVNGEYKTKCQMLLKKCKNVDLKHCSGSRSFIDNLNDMDYVSENLN